MTEIIFAVSNTHLDVLNRCMLSGSPEATSSKAAEIESEQHITKVMMYMFPRQFKLHNVFDSPTDHMRTVQKLHDYTTREDEISSKFPADTIIKTPKRLRGEARRLVQRLQILHGRCSYARLLKHYCPVSKGNGHDDAFEVKGTNSSKATDSLPHIITDIQATPRPPPHTSTPESLPLAEPTMSQMINTKTLSSAASPASSVSAFCQAVLSKIIPDDFWGSGDIRHHNKTRVMRKIDKFIKLRQYESMSLHDVVQDVKLVNLPWLTPPKLSGIKCSLAETRIRTDIFLEFLYFVFDSLLIPLIRSNFYVTESGAHKYRLLFFRHDVWKSVADPALALIKTNMFEEVAAAEAQRILATRKLGFGQFRLLPKEQGVRPIMNLKKRHLVGPPGKEWLGPSINSVLAPVHAMLKYSKVCASGHNSWFCCIRS